MQAVLVTAFTTLATCLAQAGSPAALISPLHAAIYAQAKIEFARANFFKPAAAQTSDLPYLLAPLILQQTRSATRRSLPDLPGTPFLTNGVVSVDPSRAAVFVESDSVELNGRTHARFSYTWCYAPAEVQGVRLTLGSDGRPLIWEVLRKQKAQCLIFVSESLEAAARQEFGPPLPGRKFSIETSLAKAPDTIVARVLADGPVPMGPMVYLRAHSHEVASLLCRCMPVQVKSLVSSEDYQLTAITGDFESLLSALAEKGGLSATAYLRGTTEKDPVLGSDLRLPKDF